MTRFALMTLVMMMPVFATPFGAAPEHPAVKGTSGAACVSCHQDVMSRRVMHGPVAAGDCATCHVVGTAGGRRRITLKSGASGRDTAALCVTCHQEITDRLKQPHRHAPVAAGHCTACHDAHGSPFRFQLPAEGNRACTKCHEDIAQALAQSHVHAPAAASCQICHDPHGTSSPAQLRTAGNAVCLSCHVDVPVDVSAVEGGLMFGRRLADGIERLIATGPRILLDGALASGHPTIAHPVAERPDPTARGRTLGCASCHNPHGSAGPKLLRFGATGVSSLCIRCHTF
jgi:predicted CXXCH cytochrome family protein